MQVQQLQLSTKHINHNYSHKCEELEGKVEYLCLLRQNCTWPVGCLHLSPCAGQCAWCAANAFFDRQAVELLRRIAHFSRGYAQTS